MSKDKTVDLFLVEQRALERWQTDAAIREEFLGDRDTYVAYEKATASGRVRMYGVARTQGGQ